MSKNKIHYLWVGAPTSTDPNAIAGHDIAGPIKMAQALEEQSKKEKTNNPIVFWCFKEYKKEYEEQFKKAGVHIKVCSIEHLLKKESKDKDLGVHAKHVLDFMQSSKISATSPIQVKIAFKDYFSLFLLASKGGYFFDTNVFPKKGEKVNLPGEPEVTTAKSGYQNTNDFYMMYSPKRACPRMLKIFDAWRQNPGLGNLNAFWDREAPIPYFKSDLGVKKLSYKSYFGKVEQGLFYWLSKTQDLTDAEYFAESLRYGNINEQKAYPQSTQSLEHCSLTYLKKEVTPEKLLALPFPTPTAYVKAPNWQMYYVNKKTNSVTLVYEGSSSIFGRFPDKYSPEAVKLAQPSDLYAIINALEKPVSGHPLMVNTTQEYYPEHIVNKENCTPLHHAVLTRNVMQVELLLKANARRDLKASYELKPKGELLELTAEELAQYLQFNEILSLFQGKEEENEIKQPTRLPEPGYGRKIWRFFKSSKNEPSSASMSKSHSP